MSAQIEVVNEAAFPLDEARLKAVAARVLQQEKAASDAALTIVISNDESVAALNRQFRDIDAPTDVLSFPAEMPAIEGLPVYLGDLIIAYPYAQAQAVREAQDLMQSLALLVVHGTLHLLGYDHDTPARREAMWSAQDQVLRSLDLPLSLVPSYEHD